MSDLKQDKKSKKKRNISEKTQSSVFTILKHPMKIQFLIAFCLALVAYIGYNVTIAPIALPDDSSEYLPVISEAIPRFTYKNHIWQSFLNILFNVGGSLAFINNICAIISALAVGMLYLVASSLMGLFLNGNSMGGVLKSDNPNGEIDTDKATSRIQYYASVLAGATAAMCLAFSPPYWMVATMSYYHSFYLLWLLISAYCVLRFGMTAKLPYLYVFCFIHALGMTQASCFVAFAPLFFVYAAYVLLASEKLNLKTSLISLVLVVLGFSFVFHVVSSYCSSEIAQISNKTRFFPILKEVLGSLVHGVYNDLPQVGWMIILGVTIAPFVASFISGRRSLNGESDWSFYALNIAIFVATLVVVFDSRISPWNMFGFSNPHIIPYLLVSMTLGYSMAYLYVQSIYWFKYIPNFYNFGAVVRCLAIALSVVISLISIVNNYSKADNKRLAFVNTYVDKLLLGMKENNREWLVTDGVIDNVITIRAKEKGQTLYLLGWEYYKNPVSTYLLKKDIEKSFPNNIRLRNIVDVGTMPVLQEWIQDTSGISDKLGLMIFPDVWSFGDYDSYPCGLTFCGMNSEKLATCDLSEDVKKYEDTIKQIKEELPPFKEVAKKDMKREDIMADFVRRKLSFIGNNLAFVLEQQGKIKEAFELYDLVREFDPDNISALLNVSALVQKYDEFKYRQNDVTEALSNFQRRNSSSQAIWSISRVYGYVSRPEVFAQLGWTWALSGQNNMALKSLARVLNHADVENTNVLKNMMAKIYSDSKNVVASEQMYLEVLKTDPADVNALQGLILLYMNNGNFEEAKKWLKPAENAGVPHETILFYTATMLIFSDALDEARIVLNELKDINPNNIQAVLLEMQICHSIYEKSEDEAVKREALETIAKNLDVLRNIEGPDSFVTKMAEADYFQLVGKYKDARHSFMIALKATRSKENLHKNINQTPIYEEILKMDINLNDKEAARHHAKQLLHLDTNNWLANYALGSLALSAGSLIEAKDYLQRSVESNPSLMAINDLAFTHYSLGEIQEATDLIERGIKKDEKFYVLWDTYGSIKLQEHKYDEAELYFKRAIKLYDNDLRPHLHLANVYYQTSRYDECREIMRRLSSSSDVFVGQDRDDYDFLTKKLLTLE